MNTADELEPSEPASSDRGRSDRPLLVLDRTRTITIVTIGHIIAGLLALSLFRYVDGPEQRAGDIRLEQATVALVVVLLAAWSIWMFKILRSSRPSSGSIR